MTNERYEYKTVGFHNMSTRHSELDLNKLNALGAEGWELVMIIDGDMIFKRPIGWGFRV